MKLLILLQKKLVWTIPITMILGLIYGNLFDVHNFKSLIMPLTFLMVYPMMVNLDLKKVFSRGDAKLQIYTQAINFILIPLLGFSLGLIFFKDSPMIMIGILLTALLPTSGMTISWTGLSRGNMPSAVKMTVLGLILGSFLTPVYLKLFLGTAVEIPFFVIFRQIILIVFLPMFLGYLTQQYLFYKYGEAKYNKQLKKIFPPFSTLGVLGIVFVAMALKSKAIMENPEILVMYLVPLLIMYLLNFLISTFIGKFFFSRNDAIALVYGSVMRNLSIALAIAMTAFGDKGSEIALVIAMAYIIQVQAGAWYAGFVDKIFGEADPLKLIDIIERGIYSVSNDSKLDSAVKLLNEEHIHSVVVTNKKGKVKGIITSGMVAELLTDEKKSIETVLSEIDYGEVLKFSGDTSLVVAAKKMKKKHLFKAIVTESGLPAGLVTETDIIKRFNK